MSKIFAILDEQGEYVTAIHERDLDSFLALDAPTRAGVHPSGWTVHVDDEPMTEDHTMWSHASEDADNVGAEIAAW